MGKKDAVYLCIILLLVLAAIVAVTCTIRSTDNRITAVQRELTNTERERDNALKIVADAQQYNSDSIKRVDSLKSGQARIIARANAAGDRIDGIRIELESSLDLARQYEEILRGYGYILVPGEHGLSGGAQGSGKADIQK
ncbi:hypothetical protein FACS189479_04350 [Spirochaetia bacterium]|nr:hypothetical protein FACS189479_04350 [Spirochaetia bacterium]